MAKEKTRRILTEAGFAEVAEDEYDPAKHNLLVGEGEMVVKPKGVEKAKPFIIDEKDFDERSYERVNQTAAVASEIAKQTDRQTLTEEVEARGNKF